MKILVFGGNGMLGHVVVKYFVSKDHDVSFTVRSKVPTWMPLIKPARVMKFEATNKIPDLTGYDWVINCIGNIKQKEVSQPSDFYQVNSVLPWRLALACKKVGVKLIHISSDCVFSGKKLTNGYNPGETMDAEDDYGISKALGEPSDAVILRTSIIGPSDVKLGLFEWFRHERKKIVTGYENHLWSGVTTLFLAQFMERLMTENILEIPEAGGLIQIASPPVTKALLLQLINDVFDLKKEITPHCTPEPINRTLIPSVTPAPDIHSQLVELRDWMKLNG